MAINATSRTSYDYLLSTTLDNFRSKITDNIMDARVLSWYLKDKGRVRMISGGQSIVEPLLTGLGQADSYAEWEQISITPQQGISAAVYDWKQLVATIAISGLEELKNNGEEAVVNLLETKIMQAEETFQNRLNHMLWGEAFVANQVGSSGTNITGSQTAADATNDFLGLADYIASTGAVGGINPATAGNEFWASYQASLSGVAETELRARMTTAYNTAGNGKERPDALFTDQTSFELFESQLTPNLRYEDTKSANLGFQNLTFKGVPLYWDTAAPAGVMYGVTSKYIGLVGHKDRWFTQSKFTESPVSSAHATSGAGAWVDARYAVITAAGNLTCRNRQRHFKLTGINAMV
jgi:hypothetical protein